MRYDELQDEIKNAMRAKDKPKLSILRQVHGEIKNIEVNERRDITDADVDAMLKRLIKQTKETLDGSIKAGNDQEPRWPSWKATCPSRCRATSWPRSSTRC